MTPGLDKLSEGQRACLRLVMQHMTSKEIALQLGISSHTVDQRLRLAMRALKTDSRTAAAQLLAAAEAGLTPGDTAAGSYQRLIYQSPYIARADETVTIDPMAEGWRQGAVSPDMVHDRRARFDETFVQADPPLLLPFPTRGRKQNDLAPTQRLLWIGGIAIFAAISFGALLSGLAGLADLFGWTR